MIRRRRSGHQPLSSGLPFVFQPPLPIKHPEAWCAQPCSTAPASALCCVGHFRVTKSVGVRSCLEECFLGFTLLKRLGSGGAAAERCLLVSYCFLISFFFLFFFQFSSLEGKNAPIFTIVNPKLTIVRWSVIWSEQKCAVSWDICHMKLSCLVW